LLPDHQYCFVDFFWAPVPFELKDIAMMFRKKAFEQTSLTPISVMTAVLKGAFIAVSAVTAGRINSTTNFNTYRIHFDK
jgi:hypothetical protein